MEATRNDCFATMKTQLQWLGVASATLSARKQFYKSILETTLELKMYQLTTCGHASMKESIFEMNACLLFALIVSSILLRLRPASASEEN